MISDPFGDQVGDDSTPRLSRQPEWRIAVEPGKVDFRVPILAESARDAISVRGKGSAGVCSWKLDDTIARSAAEIDQVNIGVATLVSCVGKSATVC